MSNELSFLSEEALDGSSGHVCCFDEEAYPGVLQASDNLINGGAVRRQITSALVIDSEGDGT